ncbi:MAG: ABC transporter permease [Nitrospirota bacterium]|nr:ABC transporter permease [Nitrospirota bacterium]
MIKSRLLPILKKEFIQIRRDRLTLAMILIMPVFQLVLFGYALNTDVKHLPTAVYDQSRSQESRELLEAFKNSKYFNLDYYVQGIPEVTRLVDGGKAVVGIVIPPDFERDLKTGKSAQVQVIVDASDPSIASSAINTAAAIGQVRSLEIITSGAGSSHNQVLPVDMRIRAWYNSDLSSANFLVPGLLGIILQMATTMLTSMAIVRERERGTLEQLIVTPVKRYELMVGKIIPYVLVGYVQISLALYLGVTLFDVPVKGSVTLFYVLTLFFLTATLGLGILISTLAKNQMQALQMSFFVFLPSIYLSGFIFPREGMPDWAAAIGYAIPLTYYLHILRGIILKGIGIEYLWKDVLPLGLLGLGIIVLSISRFRKKIE